MTQAFEEYRPTKNSRTAGRVIDGKALIVVVDERQLHTLNEVATRIWELCDGRSLGAIADAITTEFEVDRSAALRDAVEFVSELQRLGALEGGAPGGAQVSERADVVISRVEQATGRPLRAMIEVSDRCNEVCVHCYQEQGLKGEMSTEQVKAVIDDLAAMGVLMLTFSGGEATLRKDLLDLIGYARSRGFSVGLFTNGLTMTEMLARALADHAVRVVEISIYSHRAEVHDFVTGVPGSFDKSVAGVRHLVALGVDVHIKTNVMSVNEHELDEYRRFADELGASFALSATSLMPREANDRVPEMLDPSPAAYRRVQGDPALSRAKSIGPRGPKPLDTMLCGAGNSVLVEPNGEIRPCTSLHLDLGDASGGGLREYRSGDVYKHLRALRWRDVHGCRSCELRAHCTRCYARGLAEVGDALAPYPSACMQARTSYDNAYGVAADFGASDAGAPSVGPYRRVGEHTFEPFADEITAEDDALATQLGWARRPSGGLSAPAHVRPGTLVQLRRPGRVRPRLEQVPEAKAVSAVGCAAGEQGVERASRHG